MKKIIQKKALNQQDLTGKYIGTTIDRDEVKKLIEYFLKEEEKENNFRWVIKDVKKYPGITVDQMDMDKDYSSSLDAIEKYLDNWLKKNYESPVVLKEKKRKLSSRLLNVKIRNKHQ